MEETRKTWPTESNKEGPHEHIETEAAGTINCLSRKPSQREATHQM